MSENTMSGGTIPGMLLSTKMTQEALNFILKKHRLWLEGSPCGERANLSGKNLSGANLSRANLSRANLRTADLSGANLSRADLGGANLSGANLFGANLIWADLGGANLSGANLSGANICGANLRRANLSGANLSGANLGWAILDDVIANENTSFFHLQCPEKGSFIAWKKAVTENKSAIVELLVPEDALRSSATTRKCRVSKATVLGIQNLDGTPAQVQEARSEYDYDFIYRTGETVEVKDFDTNRWKECAPGIHCFITRQEAVDYEI